MPTYENFETSIINIFITKAKNMD
uniref:Uncharacterized protein n=1 Tax=Arundo donax TaxID=35708 RepID=A0A0A9ENC4_ARUDO